MVIRAKIIWAAISAICLVIIISTLYLGFRKILSLPFRQTNDLLHEKDFPVTLDFLIPAGFYIDDKITVQEVLYHRINKPGQKAHLFLSKVAESIPIKYRVTATTIYYLFWTLLFLVFFRIFTWMRYATALRLSFFLGAAVYFFMPDFLLGKIDDSVFLAWALTLFGLRWLKKRKNVKRAQSAQL
jgi:hypothetical protein